MGLHKKQVQQNHKYTNVQQNKNVKSFA